MALGEASVRVTLDVSRFERELRNKVERAANTAARRFDSVMTQSIAQTAQRATREFRANTVTGMSRAGRDAVAGFRQNVLQGMGGLAGDVNQRLRRGLVRGVASTGTDMGRGLVENLQSSVQRGAGPIARSLTSSIRQSIADRAGGLTTSIQQNLTDGVARKAAQAGTEAGRRFSINFGAGAVQGTRGMALAIGTITTALASDLAPVTGILAAIPSALTQAGAAAGVAAASFVGLSDALEAIASGDAAETRTALDALAPAAQRVGAAFADAWPQLQQFQQSLQNAAFSRVTGQVQALSQAFGQSNIASEAQGIADALGDMVSNVASTTTSTSGIQAIEQALRGTATSIDTLTPGVADLTSGLLTLAGSAAPAFNAVASAVSGAASAVGQWATEVAASGQASEWIYNAVTGFGQLADTAGDVASIASTVLAAMQPLGQVMGLVVDAAVALADAFSALPGPVQAAVAALVVVNRLGVPAAIGRITSSLGEMRTAFRTQMQGAIDETQQLNQAQQTTAASTESMSARVGSSLAGIAQSYATARDAAAATAAQQQRVTQVFGATNSVYRSVADGVQNLAATTAASFTAMNDAVTRTEQRFAALRSSLDYQSIVAGVQTFGVRTAAAFSTVNDAVTRTEQRISEVGSSIASSLSRSLIQVEAGATDAARGLTTSVVPAMQQLSERSYSAAQRLRETLGNAMNRAAASSLDLQDALREGPVAASQELSNQAVSAGFALRNNVVDGFTRASVAAQSFSRPVVQGFQRASTAVTSFQGVLSNAVSGMANSVSGLASSINTGVVSSMRRLGTAAVGAGAAIRTGLSTAVSGLVGALGGPWGLAITGAVTALGLLANSQRQASQEASAHRQALASLTDTLDRGTGAITDATRAQIEQRLQQEELVGTSQSAADAASELGINLGLVTDAMLGNQSAQQQLNAEMVDLTENALRTNGEFGAMRQVAEEVGLSLRTVAEAARGNTQAQEQVRTALQDSTVGYTVMLQAARSADGTIGSLDNSLSGLSGELSEAQQRARELASSMSPAEQAVNELSSSLETLADNASDADEKSRALNSAMRVLSGGAISAQRAQLEFDQALADAAESMDQANTSSGALGDALLRANDRINTTTENGRILQQNLQDMSQAFVDNSAALLQMGQRTGETDQALQQISQNAQRARDQFIQQARSMGIGANEASRLADQYFRNVGALRDMSGQIETFQSQLLNQRQQLGLTENEVAQLSLAYANLPEDVRTQIGAPGALVTKAQLLEVKNQAEAIPGNKPVEVDALTAEAQQRLRDMGFQVEQLPDGSFRVTAETEGAEGELSSLVARWSNRTITFLARVTGIGGNAAGGIVPNAEGGIRNYADGGTAARKQSGLGNTMAANYAEVVPPQTHRVIGDRARGDEAYIPITNSARSRRILDTTARRMGYDLVSRRDSQPVAQSTTNFNEGSITVNAPYADPELVARQVVNEIARTTDAR